MAMPEFRNTKTDEATAKNREATEFFEQSTHARERADDYVRVTAFLATVLLLSAISQRFRSGPSCLGGSRSRCCVFRFGLFLLCRAHEVNGEKNAELR
jgi:hypothetical protein